MKYWFYHLTKHVCVHACVYASMHAHTHLHTELSLTKFHSQEFGWLKIGWRHLLNYFIFISFHYSNMLPYTCTHSDYNTTELLFYSFVSTLSFSLLSMHEAFKLCHICAFAMSKDSPSILHWRLEKISLKLHQDMS